MRRATIQALAGASLVTLAFAGVASADTLQGRSAPFAPAQAPADQYTTPPDPVPPADTPGDPVPPDRGARDTPAGDRPTPRPAVGGVGAEGDPAPRVGASVEAGATAPKARGGSLPFTGSDLSALVWIALALVGAGAVLEVARRRLGAAA